MRNTQTLTHMYTIVFYIWIKCDPRTNIHNSPCSNALSVQLFEKVLYQHTKFVYKHIYHIDRQESMFSYGFWMWDLESMFVIYFQSRLLITRKKNRNNWFNLIIHNLLLKWWHKENTTPDCIQNRLEMSWISCPKVNKSICMKHFFVTDSWKELLSPRSQL